MYNKAIELDPNNLLLENNKAAVYLEMGDYEKCIKTCNDAIDRRYDVMADFTVVSKVFITYKVFIYRVNVAINYYLDIQQIGSLLY